MIVISQSLLLAPSAENPLNTPIIGWRNLVLANGVAATSEAMDAPASNVANPSTALRWRADPGSPAGDQYLTALITETDPVDYVAIAVHNLGSGEIPVSIEGATEQIGSPLDWDWTELVEDTVLPDDGPAIFRFTPQSLAAFRIKMQPGIAAPEIAVVYAGKLLVLERGTHADQIPINLGRTSKVTNAKSENGNFLGRIVMSESVAATFALKLLRQSWYRQSMDPFIVAAKEDPFFFAWKPQQYPRDVGYCTMTNDPQPSISFDTDRVSVSLQMGGVSV